VRKDRVKTVACLIALVILALVVKVSGGTHTERIHVTGYHVNPESTMVRIFEIGSGSQVGDDSVTGTYPDSFLFTLDSGKVYKVEPYEIWWDATNAWGLQYIWTVSLRDVGISVADVWTAGTRTLTAIDEDATTLDFDATVVGGVTNQVTADVTAISGDATAADNLEAMLDGTRAKLYLTSLDIRATGDDTAIVAIGADSGLGAFFWGGARASGMEARGGTVSGSGFVNYAPQGVGLYIIGGNGNNAAYYLATDGGHALQLSASGTGLGRGLHITSDSGDAVYLQAGGQPNVHGIEVRGGTGSGGDAIRIVATATGADGIDISAADGNGLYIDATEGNAFELLGDTAVHLNGDDADFVGDITGNLSGSVGSVTGAVGSVTGSVGSMATAGMDALWQYDTSLIASGVGEMLKDTSAYEADVSGVSTHSAADVWTATGGDSALNAIDDANKGNFKADVSALALESSLFDPATTAVTPTDTTEPGDTLAVKKDSLIYQGAAASPSAVADAVWDESQSGHTSAGTFGKYLDVEVSSISGCLGTGSDTLIYYTVDTSNDVRVEGVTVSMYTIGGSQVGGPQTTDANGYVLYALNSGDTLLPIVYGPHQYTWGKDTLFFTGQTSDSAMGYRIADPSPPSPDYATVKGFVISPSDYKFFGATVEAIRITGEFGTDTSGTPYIVGKKDETVTIDTLGYFSMFLKRTGTYDDTTTGFYNIIGQDVYGDQIFNIIEVYVPDTGDVDLGLVAGRRE